MLRRTTMGVLAGAALVTALRPALAQTPPPVIVAGTPSSVRELAMAGSVFALQTSQVALTRTSNPQVRQFAEFESAEQQAIMTAMRTVGVPTPTQIVVDPVKAQALQTLPTLSGAEFDRMYLEGQLNGHQELLTIMSQIAASGATPGERAIAMVAEPSIQTHIALIRGIQMGMRP
ncbi:DUF4142 domain-containing protein [Muricoccus radiodurans]|uniref:DUF4142 domain-containing protein n=1 Tax=Muricoccus radiodurans TaxID=2231721 RepID=UPI003CF40D7D